MKWKREYLLKYLRELEEEFNIVKKIKKTHQHTGV